MFKFIRTVSATLTGGAIVLFLSIGSLMFALTTADASASSVPFPLCASGVSLQSYNSGKYLQVSSNGTIIANASSPTPATKMDVCVTGGRWSIYSWASHGYWRPIPWRDNLVLADAPSVSPTNLADQLILGCNPTNHEIFIRFRSNTLYAEIAGGAEPFALGRNPNNFSEEFVSYPMGKLAQFIGGECVMSSWPS